MCSHSTYICNSHLSLMCSHCSTNQTPAAISTSSPLTPSFKLHLCTMCELQCAEHRQFVWIYNSLSDETWQPLLHRFCPTTRLHCRPLSIPLSSLATLPFPLWLITALISSHLSLVTVTPLLSTHLFVLHSLLFSLCFLLCLKVSLLLIGVSGVIWPLLLVYPGDRGWKGQSTAVDNMPGFVRYCHPAPHTLTGYCSCLRRTTKQTFEIYMPFFLTWHRILFVARGNSKVP